jgi:hypothetical protein
MSDPKAHTFAGAERSSIEWAEDGTDSPYARDRTGCCDDPTSVQAFQYANCRQ